MQATDYFANYPEYLEAKTRLNELRGELDALEKEITSRYTVLSNLQASSRKDRLTHEAESLIAGKSAKTANEEMVYADIRELRHRQTVLRKAVEIQTQAVAEWHAKASAEICRELAPRHLEIVRKQAECLVELARANAEEDAFRSELIRAGVSFTHALRPMPVEPVGLPTDRNSFVALYIRECVAHDILSGGEGFLRGVNWR